MEVLADSYTKTAPLSSRATGINDDIDPSFGPLFGAINVAKVRQNNYVKSNKLHLSSIPSVIRVPKNFNESAN